MKRKDMISIFEKDNPIGKFGEGDRVFLGMQIISKYTDQVIHGADHDIIYSEDIDTLIEAGITEEECEQLNKMNWMIHDDEYLAKHV